MSIWEPDELAMIWQSAPAHVLQGRACGGQQGSVTDGTDARRGAATRRPPDGRPPQAGPPARRPTLTARPSARDSGGSAREEGGTEPADLERLAGRIRGMAADLVASLCAWLHLVAEFDRARGWADAGMQSCAAWLSWTCSVAPGTAREYVRIARALRLLPLVDAAFAAGQLSYSKVRLLVQVATEVDEVVLVQQAQVQAVSQIERTVREFRRSAGWSQQRKRRATWRWDEDGMLVLSARLPADEGALLLAALERARDDVAPPSGEPERGPVGEAPGAGEPGSDYGDGVSGGDEVRGGDGAAGDGAPVPGPTPAAGGSARHPMPPPTDGDRQLADLTGADPLGVSGADTLVALALRALAAGEVDNSGDDRHLLVLHADLDQLVGDEGDKGVEDALQPTEPAEGIARSTEPVVGDASPGADRSSCARGAAGPGGRNAWRRTAATTTLAGARCHLENGPGLDRRTAQRIACDAALVAVLHHVGEGEPLRLGRKTRTISPAQRRALRVRDGGCGFPACHRRKHLEAHHVQHWSLLGPTDLENLVLLCRVHHMLIHEGGFRVSPAGDTGWEFRDPHGVPVPVAPVLPGGRRDGAQAVRAPDPLGLLPGWTGEPFHLAETVAVLARSPRGDVR